MKFEVNDCIQVNTVEDIEFVHSFMKKLGIKRAGYLMNVTRDKDWIRQRDNVKDPAMVTVSEKEFFLKGLSVTNRPRNKNNSLMDLNIITIDYLKAMEFLYHE